MTALKLSPEPSTASAEAVTRPMGLPHTLPSTRRVPEVGPLTHVGRFVLRRTLAATRHTSLHMAWDPLLSRSISVRTYRLGLRMASRIAADRVLLRLARNASEVHHRHVAHVVEAGLSAHGVYMVLEKLRGTSLREALATGKWRPDAADCVRLVRRLADATAALHEHGLVHGGIEPGAVFLCRNGRPKLLDLGVVHALREARINGLDDMELGLLAYRAPENLALPSSDERCDVYALGVLLYELLSGTRPFQGQTDAAICDAITSGRCLPLTVLCPQLPSGLTQLVDTCMAVQPAARPPSAAALATALKAQQGLLGGRGGVMGLPMRLGRWLEHWRYGNRSGRKAGHRLMGLMGAALLAAGALYAAGWLVSPDPASVKAQRAEPALESSAAQDPSAASQPATGPAREPSDKRIDT